MYLRVAIAILELLIPLRYGTLDSAGRYAQCGTTNGWSVEWVSNYVLRNDGRNMGEDVGEFQQPGEVDAPQPGQNFRYINDARNAGTREITNARWYCPSGQPRINVANMSQPSKP